MSVNLENLQYCLERAFNYIEKCKIHNKNTVLCLGNTGCGKSTMITALIYGKQVLEQKKKEREIQKRDGTTKISYELIIDHKPGLNIKGFKIGHDPANSETFLPHFWKDPKNKMVFADIAGLNDSGGPLMTFINCFVNKKIF